MIVELKYESKHHEKGRGLVYVVSRITNPKLIGPELVHYAVMIDGKVWRISEFKSQDPPSDLVNLYVKPYDGWRTYQDLSHLERAWILRRYNDLEAHVLSDSEFTKVGSEEVQRRKRQATSPTIPTPDEQQVLITTASLFKPLGPALATVITAGTGLMKSDISDGAIACASCGSKLFKVKWSPVALACNQCGQIVDTPDGEVVGALVRKK